MREGERVRYRNRDRSKDNNRDGERDRDRDRTGQRKIIKVKKGIEFVKEEDISARRATRTGAETGLRTRLGAVTSTETSRDKGAETRTTTIT